MFDIDINIITSIIIIIIISSSSSSVIIIIIISIIVYVNYHRIFWQSSGGRGNGDELCRRVTWQLHVMINSCIITTIICAVLIVC